MAISRATRGQQQYPAKVALVQIQGQVGNRKPLQVVAIERFTCKRPGAITIPSEWECRFTIFGSDTVNEQLRGAPYLQDHRAAPQASGQGWVAATFISECSPSRPRGGDGESAAARLHVDKMPTYPLQLTCLGVIYGTPALAAVFVALRIYTRRKLNLRLGWGMYCTLAMGNHSDKICR